MMKGKGGKRVPLDQPVIRWVTWWPVPYWTNRFNRLSDKIGGKLEIVFLAKRSAYLGCSTNERSWTFRYRYLSQESSKSGYYGPKLEVVNPLPLVRGRFDALVMNYAHPATVIAAALCWLLHKPYWIFSANTQLDSRQARVAKDWLKTVMMNRAQGVLVTGPLQRDYVLSLGVARSKVNIVGNPVEPFEAEPKLQSQSRRKSLRVGFGWEDRVVVLYVGRVAPEKGLTAALEALDLLNMNDGIRPLLCIVGVGSEAAHLRSLARRYDVDVEFPGFQEGEALAERYAAADIFLLPSVSEPWGLVVNEAMRFGLPLILSDRVGCAPVLLRNDSNGYMFEVGNATELAEKMKLLFVDEDRRRRMGQLSKRIIAEHSIDNWVDAVIAATRVQKIR